MLISISAIAAKTPVSKVAKDVPQNDLLLEINGKIYPKDTFPEQCKQLLQGVNCAVDSYGHYHVESKKEGDLVYSKAVFSTPDGPQVVEESWEKDGRVKKAKIENQALAKTSELEVKNGKVYYKTTEKDGTVKTSEDDAEDNLVVPSTVMSFIRPHHPQLLAGQEVKVRVAVLDRREAFSFTIKKIRDEKSADGEPVMVLQMAPGSIFVKALVDPMYFYVRPKTGEMFAFEGKSALRRKEGDKYKEMVVRAAYEYKVNAWNESTHQTAQAAAQTTLQKQSSCNSNEIFNATGSKCEVKPE